MSRTRAVFAHGNPETAAIWEPLLAELHHPDTVTLAPPGFGAPVPEDFGATADEYATWLVSELERQQAPVDLIGHDWGGGHVVRVAIEAAGPDPFVGDRHRGLLCPRLRVARPCAGVADTGSRRGSGRQHGISIGDRQSPVPAW